MMLRRISMAQSPEQKAGAPLSGISFFPSGFDFEAQAAEDIGDQVEKQTQDHCQRGKDQET